MASRPARSTPVTAPLASRVKKPRWPASPEDSFEFGLQVILDGLQDRLASRR
jgi:hypothetical protein